jgi:FkbM family methyltransferase
MIKIGNIYVPDHDAGRFQDDISMDQFVHEPLNKAMMYVKKFDNAIDVGTWIGDTTYIMAKKFKNVIGFEANNAVHESCLKNLLENNIQNCNVINIGLSNKKSEQYFLNKTKKTNSGWISTLTLSPEEEINAKKVQTTTLDDFNYTDIDFIKIDVDSHEGFLLEGAFEFFKVNSPVIQIEIKVRTHYRQNSSMPDAFKLLDSFGYTCVENIGKADYIFIKK